MSIPDGQLIRKAFLTKYGYSPDLTYEEILCEFQKRYDHAQALRLTNGGLHRVMLVIEGMAESSAKEEASLEREVRKLKIERLTARERLRSHRTGPIGRRIRRAARSRVDPENMINTHNYGYYWIYAMLDPLLLSPRVSLAPMSGLSKSPVLEICFPEIRSGNFTPMKRLRRLSPTERGFVPPAVGHPQDEARPRRG